MSTPAVPAAGVLATAPAIASIPVAAVPGACASCGEGLLGDFCHRCGERRMRPDELALRAFARDVASEVGDLDSRLYRSLGHLLLRPGFLTAEFLAGRRRAYVGPLKLFLVAFAAMLLVQKLFSRLPLAEAVREIDGSRLGTMLAALAARLGTSEVEALERLNDTAMGHSSWLSLLIPVLLGAVVAAVFFRWRRGYVGHLVFAAHVATFYLFLMLAAYPVQLLARDHHAVVGPLMGLVVMGGMWGYLWRATARVYGTGGWRGALLAIVLLVGYTVAQGTTTLLSFGTAALALLYL
jgi:Protein of unknown function (DUF3667)